MVVNIIPLFIRHGEYLNQMNQLYLIFYNAIESQTNILFRINLKSNENVGHEMFVFKFHILNKAL